MNVWQKMNVILTLIAQIQWALTIANVNRDTQEMGNIVTVMME